MPVTSAVAMFRSAPFRWWISGGLALELHLGRSWRRHDDTDIGVVRADVPRLASVLHSWDIHVAAAGQLTPWSGDPVRAADQQNNIWCRRTPESPWELDVTVGEGDEVNWIYRRDTSLRVPWDEAVLRTTSGVPYLAPELQLLFKSKNVRDKDDVDARHVIPLLAPERVRRLAAVIPADHAWRALLPDEQRR
jgi:hypothetical protein